MQAAAISSVRPYSADELSALATTLDTRWPRLPDDEAVFWLRRYRSQRSPYSRVRRHAIRAQLDAIVTLALELGLTRSEIRDLSIDDAHPDNEYILVLDDSRRVVQRVVTFTDSSRAQLARWSDVRWFLDPETRSMWSNTHASSTAHLPMKADVFNRLLSTYVGPGWELRRLRATEFASTSGCLRHGYREIVR